MRTDRRTRSAAAPRRRRPLVAVLAGLTGVAALSAAALALGTGSASAAELNTSWYAQAPYVMPLSNNPPDLPTVMSQTGEKAFMLAFILADGSSCAPAWDGTSPVSSDTAVAAVIDEVRDNGGDVSVSVGGYNGTKLGQVCSSPQTTAAAYQEVIDTYDLKAIDLDLEEPEYEDLTAVSNELGAAQILQQDNPGLYISITLPGTAAGTGYFGQNALNTAADLGFTPDNWSIMPFDGGFDGGAASQQSALTAFNSLLQNTFGWSEAEAWAHEGISQMNGRSDTGEIFTTDDFADNLSFAQAKGLGRFTFWSVNRDRECDGGANDTTSGTCSSVAQDDWAFTDFGVRFAGSSDTGDDGGNDSGDDTGDGGATADPTTDPTDDPTTDPTATATATVTATTTTTATSCSGAAAWSSAATYNGGDVVSYDGHLWSAKWWSYNDTPGGAAGVWADQGAC